jgi:hypothetical protein
MTAGNQRPARSPGADAVITGGESRPPTRRCQTHRALAGSTVVPGTSSKDSTRIGTFG